MIPVDKRKKHIRALFTDEILLNFWTHEKCPPTVNIGFKKCQLNAGIKHERCMPCWEKWLDEFIDKILDIIKSSEWIEFSTSHGLRADPKWAPQGRSFDGIDDYIEVPDKIKANILSAENIKLDSEITLSFKSRGMTDYEHLTVTSQPANWIGRMLRRFILIKIGIGLEAEKGVRQYFAGTITNLQIFDRKQSWLVKDIKVEGGLLFIILVCMVSLGFWLGFLATKWFWI